MNQYWWLKVFVVIIGCSGIVFGQKWRPEDLGFRHTKVLYKGDTVDVLIKSKKGEEGKAKPIFLFCQGSLPQPLIKVDNDYIYPVFPFKTDSLLADYHVVVIGKPFVPLVADVKDLSANFSYFDAKTGMAPNEYSRRNFLDYYANRNLKVIKYLQRMPFVSRGRLVVAGHSEGSTVAAKMASLSKRVTHLIYASGNPLGRITSMLARDRSIESDTDSTRYTDDTFDYWTEVVKNNESLDDSNGDTPKASYTFSLPPINYLTKLNIPVLISYGTRDWSAQANDYLKIEMIRRGKGNFSFNAYIGVEHNFFGLKQNGKQDYDQSNWDRVVSDWQDWLRKN